MDAIGSLGRLLLGQHLDFSVQIGLSELISDLPITLSCLNDLSGRKAVLCTSHIGAAEL